jgi:predicted RNA polymerase sigma factor
LPAAGADARSTIALTLRAVGGLTTAEIANAYLVPEAARPRCPPRRSPSSCRDAALALYRTAASKMTSVPEREDLVAQARVAAGRPGD